MRNFLSGAALSATLFAANMAPVFANPTTNLKTGNSATVNSVASNPNLIEIEGRTLTDAEAAKVEGEAFFVPLLLIAGKVIIKHSLKKGAKATAKHSVSCVAGRTQNCNTRSHGNAFLSGATFGLVRR